MIRVRIAERDDQPRLVEFIRDHWSSTHVFVDRPDVFAWQYLQRDGRLNMVLAEDTEAGSVLGVLGFIPMGRFSPDLGDRDVLLAIWKVRDEGVPPGLGLRLLKLVQNELRPRAIAAIGTSQMVRPIYQVLGYEVGSLHQSAVFHPGRRGLLRIADGVPASAFERAPEPPAGTLDLVVVDESSPERTAIDRVAAGGVPAKSWEYVVERYLRHPWYRYSVRAVRWHGEITSVVVWRAVEANGGRILRIVDVIGDPAWLADAAGALQREAESHDAEYVDLMQWGIDPAWLREHGFVDTTIHPELVLPNYFSPFVASNIEIELACKRFDESGGPIRLYRADSDQDRPNRVDDLAPPA